MGLVRRLSPHCPAAGLAICLSLGMAYGAETQAAGDSEAILERISGKVAEHLSLLPNYTCREVIDRIERSVNVRGLSRHDRVELEVAFVGQQELFARPGDSHFEEQPITNLVTTGTIGNGLFGAHAENIFLRDEASFDYFGVVDKDGHKTYRYDFQVPLEKSLFSVNRYAKATVAYRGTFWADVETFELVRLEITADQIPSFVGIGFVKETAQYTTVRIRESEFLLPVRAGIEALTGTELSRNDVTLENCREFSGESTVTFGTPVDGPAQGAARNSSTGRP